MRAIVASSEGAVVQDVGRPSPGSDQVLVRVKAGALNRADLMMIRGAVHGGWGGSGFPLGLEFAGEVIETGSEVEIWTNGEKRALREDRPVNGLALSNSDVIEKE